MSPFQVILLLVHPLDLLSLSLSSFSFPCRAAQVPAKPPALLAAFGKGGGTPKGGVASGILAMAKTEKERQAAEEATAAGGDSRGAGDELHEVEVLVPEKVPKRA